MYELCTKFSVNVLKIGNGLKRDAWREMHWIIPALEFTFRLDFSSL